MSYNIGKGLEILYDVSPLLGSEVQTAQLCRRVLAPPKAPPRQWLLSHGWSPPSQRDGSVVDSLSTTHSRIVSSECLLPEDTGMWKHLHPFGHPSGVGTEPAELLCWDSFVARQPRDPVDKVVGRFESLDQLFDTLVAQPGQSMPYGGVVRVHPNVFEQKGVMALVATRQRAQAYGLTLLVTPAISEDRVELRQYVRPATVPRREK